MHNPDLIPNSEIVPPRECEFYEQQPRPPQGWPSRESPHALRRSLDKAHDNLKRVVRENDQLRAALGKLHRRQRLQFKLFSSAMGFTWAVMAWLLHLLLPYAIVGMHAAK
jgi:hypothetical protein